MGALDPVHVVIEESKEIKLSKREMVAAMALQGLIAQGARFNDSMLTERARVLADKLLEELEKE